MKKTNLVKGSLLVFVLSLVFLLTAIGGVDAATVYVDHNNSTGIEDGSVDNPYNTIQEGINASNLGDTVKVAPGSYSGDLTIDAKNISLIGGDPATTTIQGTSSVIRITGIFSAGSDEVDIAGFTITGGANYGIQLNSDSVKAKIHNNIIAGNSYGIYFSNNNTQAYVYNNTITSNSASGIAVPNCASPTVSVSNNIIVENGNWGIYKRCGILSAYYNNLCCNTLGASYQLNGNVGNTEYPPGFIDADSSDYHLSSTSQCIDAGQPIAADNDPDGTRNDQGAYGGPWAASFWPSPAGGPVVTNLQVTPPSVPSGGSITIRATGEIR